MEDESKHYVGKVAQKAVIEKDGKILISKGIGDKIWEFPGGRVHEDEEPLEGLIREIKEELDIDVKIEKPLHICRSLHVKSNKWRIFIGYICYIVGNNEIKIDTTEVEEIKWVSKKELRDIEMFDDCREIADIYLKL